MRQELLRFLHASLLDPAHETPAGHAENPVRRRVVCIVALLGGAWLLHASLSLRSGDPLFYMATGALGLWWLIGGRSSGPVVPGHARTRSGVGTSFGIVQSLVWGLALLVLFLAGAVMVSRIPVLSMPVQQLLDHARRGSLPLVAVLTAFNGLGEEYFFRGALFQVVPKRHRILVSTLAYGMVTAFSGIPLLVLAALMLGALTALQRRATGGFLAPTVTHLTWSLGMLFLLPGALALGRHMLG